MHTDSNLLEPSTEDEGLKYPQYEDPLKSSDTAFLDKASTNAGIRDSTFGLIVQFSLDVKVNSKVKPEVRDHNRVAPRFEQEPLSKITPTVIGPTMAANFPEFR